MFKHHNKRGSPTPQQEEHTSENNEMPRLGKRTHARRKLQRLQCKLRWNTKVADPNKGMLPPATMLEDKADRLQKINV